jgi:hypothetical protein
MYLLVATILPVRDHPKWFQIKIEKTNDGKQKWAVLRGTLDFYPKSGFWHYYPQYAILWFTSDEGKPSDSNLVMVFEHVRWDFLDVFSSNTCKGPGGFGVVAQGIVRPTKGFVWVAGPGLPKPPARAEVHEEVTHPAMGITRAPHHTMTFCNDLICPDPDAR